MGTASIAFMSILCARLASPTSADNDKNKDHRGGPKAAKSDNDDGRGNGGPTRE